MEDNGINERQNQEINLMRLAAMRQLYSDSKFLFFIKFIICIALVIIGNVLAIFKAQNDVIHNIVLLIKIISLFVPFIVFDNWINNKKILAATLQEEFDNFVLKTNWNDQLYGPKGTHGQEIINYKTKYSKKIKNGKWDEDLKNWYDVQFSQMPLSIGRVYCQSTNINWDKELRMNFKKILNVVFVSILLIIFVICSIVNIKFINLIEYVLLPFGPMIIFLIQVIKTNNKTIIELYELKNYLDMVMFEKENPKSTDEKLSELSNKLQEKIFEYRKKAFLIPDKIYSYFRNKQEELMNNYASMEKQHTQENSHLK